MSRFCIEHMVPEFANKSPEKIAYENSVLEPGTPEFDAYVKVIERNVSPEYLDLIGRWHKAVEMRVRGMPKAQRGPLSWQLVAESERHFYRAAILADDWNLTEEDVKRAQPRYGPWSLYAEDTASWPTGRWFQFAQTRWLKSRWLMVPDLPAATLAMMGYKLHTSSRYMGALTEDEISELASLQFRAEVAGKEDPAKEKRNGRYAPLSMDEVARINELLGRCPFGGELPIFDIDSSGPRNADKMTQEELLQANLELAKRGAKIAEAVHGLWYDMTGSHVRWTVSNTLGGLHGRHLRIPPTVRHLHLLRALEDEIKRRNEAKGGEFPVLDARVQVTERVIRVSLDLSPYNKSAEGHAGQWRAPFCKKDKPTSLPQEPVSEYLSRMPWLYNISPDAIGSDWTYVSRDGLKRIIEVCDAFQRREEEREVAAGWATRDPLTGEVKRKPRVHRIRKPDLDLGTTEFSETAKELRAAIATTAQHHEFRKAVAGWMISWQVPTEAVLSTMLASCGNADDSRDCVNSTVQRVRAGQKITSFRKIEELVGAKIATDIKDAFNADLAYKREYPQERAESPETMEVGVDLEEGDPEEITNDLPEPPEPEKPKVTEKVETAPETSGTFTIGKVSVAPPPKPVAKPLEPGEDREFYAYTATHMAALSVCRVIKSHETWEAGSESEFETAAERVRREAAGLPEHVAHQLARFSRQAKEVLKKVAPDKRWFLEKALAGIFALSAIGKKTISKALHAAGVGSVVNEVTTTQWGINRWKPGHNKAPRIMSWSFLKQAGVKHKDIVKLQEALSEDLEALHAPTHVRRNCMVNQPWRSHERKFLSDVNDGLQGFGQASTTARRALIQKVEKIVNGSAVLEVDYRGERTKVTVELTSLLMSCEPPYLTGEEDNKRETAIWFDTAEEAADAERAAAEGGHAPDPTDPKPFVVAQAETLVGRSFGLVKEIKSLKAVRDACQCMTVGHEKHCRTHGEVGLIFTRCKRETACPSCRSTFWDFINRWINDMKSWPEQVVVLKIKPTEDAVLIDEKAQVEIDAEEAEDAEEGKAEPPEKKPEKKPDKPEAIMSAWLEVTNVAETLPDGRRRYRVPTQEEQRKQELEEKKHKLSVARKNLAAKRAKQKESEPEKKPTRVRKVGEHMSTAVRDRLRHALQNDPGMKAIAGNPEINRVLGIRVWAALDHGLVFLPAKFVRTREDGTPFTDENGSAVQTDTMEYLRTVGAFQAPENELRVVSRAEACSLLLQLRDQVTESFDAMVLEYTQKAHDVLRHEGEEAYRLKVRELGASLVAHEFLQPAAMKPLKHNRMSDNSLPWFTREQQDAFMKAKAEEEGRDRDRCPVLVKKHETDLGCPCGLILETVTVDIRSGGVLLKNRNGYTPSREESWDAYRKAGLKVGEYHDRDYWVPPPNEARAAG